MPAIPHGIPVIQKGVGHLWEPQGFGGLIIRTCSDVTGAVSLHFVIIDKSGYREREQTRDRGGSMGWERCLRGSCANKGCVYTNHARPAEQSHQPRALEQGCNRHQRVTV